MDSVERLRGCAEGIRKMGACSIEAFELDAAADEIENLRTALEIASGAKIRLRKMAK